MNINALYDAHQAANRLGIGRQSLYRLVRAGQLVPEPYEHRSDPMRLSEMCLLSFLVTKHPMLSQYVNLASRQHGANTQAA